MFPQNSIDKAFSRFLPKPVTKSHTAAADSSVTAKMDMPHAQQCPYCKSEMTRSNCCGQPVYVCHSDRAVFPVEDAPTTTV
jgi:transposase-like protein